MTVAGLHTVPAIVDTGAPWCLLDADILAEIEPVQADSLPTERLSIRGLSYQGRLTRLIVSLRADEGEDVDLEATVFVPILNPDETWNVPNFIGLQGLLSRIRFAVDPAENVFYFGPNVWLHRCVLPISLRIIHLTKEREKTCAPEPFLLLLSLSS